MNRHWKLDTEFTFGEWEGFTVEDVLSIKPSYIDWCMREFKDTWDDEVVHELSRKMDRS